MFVFRPTCLILFVAFFSCAVEARQCSIDQLYKYTQLGGDKNDNKIYVEADNSEGDYSEANFNGDVKIRQGDTHILAPAVDFNQDKQTVYGHKEVVIANPSTAVTGEEVEYDITSQIARAKNTQYYISPKTDQAGDNGSNGHAELIEFDLANKVDNLEQVSWTTCERNKPIWQIRAEKLTIDHNKNRATAKNSVFKIGNFPVFYMPYMNFPINNERATGFLIPSIASTEERGVEVFIPFYWNIASNQDATFTLHPMNKRGLMLDSQYRLLTKSQSLQLDGSFLDHDKKYDDKKRWQISADYKYEINPNWKFDVNYQNISDKDYMEDMSGDFHIYNQWFISRYARLQGKEPWGNLKFEIRDYKIATTDISDEYRPFSQMPKIEYSKTWKIDNLKFDTRAEAVRFHKKTNEGNILNGDATRLTADLAASYRLEDSSYFIEPKISANMRHYKFSPTNNSFRDGSKQVFVPTFSLDSGLNFERQFKFADSSYRQTLEPRLFYLYTPYKNQQDIPDFDTAERSNSWNWLFERNSFVGGDKIADANQLTAALTTRFLRDSDGKEKARFSIGQIQYFSDRRVSLYGQKERTENKSALISEGKYLLDSHWSVYGLSMWDIDSHRNQRNILELKYSLDEDRYLRFGHHYSRNDWDQLSIGGGWRFSPQWRMFARNDYSLRYDQNFNTMLGVEYEDCCWAWRLAGRRYRDEPDANKNRNAIYLEFIFKGLGNMGNSSAAMLKNQLPEFKPLGQEK